MDGPRIARIMEEVSYHGVIFEIRPGGEAGAEWVLLAKPRGSSGEKSNP
jgi:hypothetical protein